jgi:dephospho-CoA kinase
VSRPFTVGLTGGIASGKTLVADTFASLGVPVGDADLIARAVVAPGSEALTEIVDTFGAECLLPDGTMNRRWMREKVFEHPEARTRLEKITHPRIYVRMQAWRDMQTTPYCILVVPLLLETNEDSLMDRILVVDADEHDQLRRLIQRDRMPETLARQMMGAQLTRKGRLELADDVLDNTGDLGRIAPQVEALHRRYLEMGAALREGARIRASDHGTAH